MAIFYCLKVETTPNWMARSPYLNPSGAVQLYPQVLGSNHWYHVQVLLRLTVSRPARLGVVPLLERVTRCYISLNNSYYFYFFNVGRPLWREDGSVIFSAMTQVQFQVVLRPTVCRPVHPGAWLPMGPHAQIVISLFENYFISSRCRAVAVLQIQLKLKVEIHLRPTVSRPVCPGVRRPFGTRDKFFLHLEMSFRQLRLCYFVAPSLTRRQICNLLFNCFCALPEQSLLGRSPAELTAIFYYLIWDSPNLEGQVPVFISPRNRVAQLYPRALGSPDTVSARTQERTPFATTAHL
jgi:hypothetical protein